MNPPLPRPLIFALALLAALPAASYSPEKGRALLWDSSWKTFRAIENMMAAPLEPERGQVLKDYIDKAILHSKKALEDARNLDQEAMQPLGAMISTLNGEAAKPGIKKIIEDMSAQAAEQEQRLEKISKLAQEFEGRIDRLPKPDKKDSKDADSFKKASRKHENRVQELRRRLAGAKNGLAEAGDLLGITRRGMGELEYEERRMQSNLRDARDFIEELEKAVKVVGEEASKLARASAEAKARIDDLGAEPKNLKRTNAGIAFAPLRASAKTLQSTSYTVTNRIADFRNEYDFFLSSEAAFNDLKEKSLRRIGAAKGSLDSADQALARLREALDLT